MVLCHGYGSSKEGFHFRAIADALAAAGLASLRFDFTGETQRACSCHVASNGANLLTTASEHAGNGESEGIFKFGGYWDEVRLNRE